MGGAIRLGIYDTDIRFTNPFHHFLLLYGFPFTTDCVRLSLEYYSVRLRSERATRNARLPLTSKKTAFRQSRFEVPRQKFTGGDPDFSRVSCHYVVPASRDYWQGAGAVLR